jgi:hypothetical protein
MNFPKNLTSILSLSLVFAIAVVVISPASANLFGPMSSESPDAVTHGANHHGMANASFQKERLLDQITRLGTTGIDVTVPQADLAAGNTAAALQWLAAYHKDHPGMAGNMTGRQPGNSTSWKGNFSFAGHHAGSTGKSAGNQTGFPHRAQETAGAA